MDKYIKRGSLIFAGIMMIFGMFLSYREGDKAAFFAYFVALMSLVIAFMSTKRR